MSLRAILLRLTLLAAALAIALPGQARQVDTAKPEPLPATKPAAPLKPDAPMQKVEVRGAADAYDPRRDELVVVVEIEAISFRHRAILTPDVVTRHTRAFRPLDSR